MSSLMNLLAALIFFTRLPFWRLREVPTECFKHVVPYWPLVGWLTGGVTAAVLWCCGQVMPMATAWLIALVSRLLITGCLHEDGLADFLDGFGGGTSRERILTIMKDSHIGTYGVIGLIIYFLLLFQLSTLPLQLLCALVVCGDSWSKCVASQLINLLPYARKEEESKARVVYRRMSLSEEMTALMGGVLPWLGMMTTRCCPVAFWPALLAPLIPFGLLTLLMKRRIQGYTGDCCGALFLLCELSFYLSCLIIYSL